MEASIIDLRYRMREVLRALERREKVKILYHGKVKGEIVPVGGEIKRKSSDHPLFGMLKNETEDPADIVFNMRRDRHNDL